MKKLATFFRLSMGVAITLAVVFVSVVGAQSQTDPLPSWNDGAAKNAIIHFVQTTTDKSSPNFVAARGPARHF